jgi:hypothetical protein
VIQAEPDEGIGSQALGLDRLVTGIAEPVGAGGEPVERLVDLAEEVVELRRRPAPRDQTLDPPLSFDELCLGVRQCGFLIGN